MLYTPEEFNDMKKLVSGLPGNGQVILTCLLLNKVNTNLEKLASLVAGDNSGLLTKLTNATLKNVCKDLGVDDKGLKTKDELIEAITK